MVYRIFGRKRKSRFHIVEPATGKTYCKAENNSQIRSHKDSRDKPHHRNECSICRERWQKLDINGMAAADEHVKVMEDIRRTLDTPREPSLAVLMGEAIEDDGHDLSVAVKVKDAGKLVTIERDGRRWTLGKQYPGFDAALRELTGP